MLNPLVFAASAGGDQIMLPEGGGGMWKTITDGVGQFITGIFTPVMNVVADSEIALAFLSVSFFFLAVRGVRRTIGAFGRGR